MRITGNEVRNENVPVAIYESDLRNNVRVAFCGYCIKCRGLAQPAMVEPADWAEANAPSVMNKDRRACEDIVRVEPASRSPQAADSHSSRDLPVLPSGRATTFTAGDDDSNRDSNVSARSTFVSAIAAIAFDVLASLFEQTAPGTV